jgi:hypothetical protein
MSYVSFGNRIFFWMGLGAVVSVGFIAFVFFIDANRYSIVDANYVLVAHYDDFDFSTATNDISSFRVMIPPGMDPTKLRAFVLTRTGGVLNFAEVSQTWFEQNFKISEWRSSARSNIRSYFNVRSMVQFKSGHLSLFHLVLDDLPIQIGPTKDGPFVSLPMTRARMIEVFGKPKRWSWSRRRGV